MTHEKNKVKTIIVAPILNVRITTDYVRNGRITQEMMHFGCKIFSGENKARLEDSRRRNCHKNLMAYSICIWQAGSLPQQMHSPNSYYQLYLKGDPLHLD